MQGPFLVVVKGLSLTYGCKLLPEDALREAEDASQALDESGLQTGILIRTTSSLPCASEPVTEYQLLFIKVENGRRDGCGGTRCPIFAWVLRKERCGEEMSS